MSGDFEWAQQGPFPKTDSCNENARYFYLPNTNSVFLFSKTCHFNKKTSFLHSHPKTLFFSLLVFLVHFCFSLFLFAFSKIRKTQTKSAPSFRKPFIDTPTTCQKIAFALLHTTCDCKLPAKIYIYAGELVLVPLFWPFKS